MTAASLWLPNLELLTGRGGRFYRCVNGITRLENAQLPLRLKETMRDI